MANPEPSTGPSTAVAARNGVGIRSVRAFPVHRRAGGPQVRAELPELAGHRIDVGDELGWTWFPERTLPDGIEEPQVEHLETFWDATAFSVDLLFTDGTRLSEVAHDQYGIAVTPEAQDDARMSWVDQWNRRTVDLSVLAGRTVERAEASWAAPTDRRRAHRLCRAGWTS